ncbi:PREDICTED: E3 ubiquitin-protein ligase SINA-like 7 [Camelina sativa]|uniref:RING-type E3 ubiquitin transferase n=1 Tax=Camelina sativa TaxID=90675 RepID=A0ABM1QI96_CAMSA|nr:PREDICTED: E3 ubiquitin-protein ligase SINA-like 7 [Camelina sativa]
MTCSSEDRNGLRNIQSQKRQRQAEVLLDRDVLDCPVCYEPLAIPVYQCDMGHVACHICWPRLNNKCPLCALPIGNKRCRAMESVLRSVTVTVPCPNAKLGCTKHVPYGRRVSNHEKKYCRFSLCSCPEITECNYTGSYNDGLFGHYMISHPFKLDCFFSFGAPRHVRMPINDKIFVLLTIEKKVLFVLQCFREPKGVYVAVNCIAPLAPEVEKFSYRISYSFQGRICSHYETPEMKRIQRVCFQTPQDKDCMFVSNSFLRGQVLAMELCISKS